MWNYLFDDKEISFEDELIDSIEHKDNKKVEATLQNDENLCNAVDISGRSLLHYAAELGNDGIITHLIKSGARINRQDKKGNTPLLLAMKKQQSAAIKVLLDSDADIHFCDNDGNNALHCAAIFGDESTTKYLIKLGAKVNPQSNDGNTPLLLATKVQHAATIKVLLESDADIYVCDKHGFSALKVALCGSTKNVDIAKLFLRHVENDCLSNSTEIAKRLMKIECPLYVAVLLEKVDVTTCMLSEGCAIDAKDPESGKTALHVAVENVDVDHVKELVFLGADVNAKDVSGKTPLARLNNFSGSIETLSILETLIATRMNLNACDNDGFMQIRWILENGSDKVVELALKSNFCYIDVLDEHKQNAIHYLAKNCNPSVVEIVDGIVDMEEIELDVRDENGLTALHCAMSVGNKDFVKYLIEQGANFNLASANGSTPFMQAVDSTSGSMKDRVECVKILLRNEARPDILLGHYFKIYNTKSVINRDCDLLKPCIAMLALRKSLDLFFNREILSKIQSHPKLKDYWKKCTNELEKMKDKRIFYSGVTLFDVLADKEHARNTVENSVGDGSWTRHIQKYRSIPTYNDTLDGCFREMKIAETVDDADARTDDIGLHLVMASIIGLALGVLIIFLAPVANSAD